MVLGTTLIPIPTHSANLSPIEAFKGQIYKVPEPCNKYVDEIEKYAWPTSTVIQIMWLESRCNPNAVNLKDSHGKCKGSHGLLQLACIHKGGNKYDPKENIKLAFEVYTRAGNSFSPWSTFKKVK